MKLELIVAAALFAAPTLAPAQISPPKAPQPTEAAVARMKANVAKIAEPSEKERWQANLELWQIEAALAGTATKSDVDRMKPLVDRIAANVTKITEPTEKVRWQANLDLWKATSTPNKVPTQDLAKLTAALDRMASNVAKIFDPAEKERWQANCDLWRAHLAKLGAATD